MPIHASEEPGSKQDVEYGKTSAAQKTSFRSRATGNDRSHSLEYIRRRQDARDKAHPPGKRGERIEDAGKRRKNGGDRPNEPLRCRAETQNQSAAYDPEGDSEEEQHEQEWHQDEAVSEEGKAEEDG